LANIIENKCPKCFVNKAFCFCHHIKKVDLQTKLSLVVHTRELLLSSNTARLAHRSLPNSDFFVYGSEYTKIDEKALVPEEYENLVLFPYEDAITLDSDYLSTIERPINLIVPDSNWRGARKIKRRVGVLRDLKCVKIDTQSRSRYFLRKAPIENGLCTFEAIIEALKIIEHKKDLSDLWSNLDHLISRVLYLRIGSPLAKEKFEIHQKISRASEALVPTTKFTTGRNTTHSNQ